MAAEKCFLEDEIDVYAVHDGLRKRHREIDSLSLSHDRKYNASKLLDTVIGNNLEDDFILVLQEYGMTYVLNRYDTFRKVCSTGMFTKQIKLYGNNDECQYNLLLL